MGYPLPAEVRPSHLRVFLRDITGPESRRSCWRISKSRSQIGASRRSSIFVMAEVRSIIRLSHWKRSQVMRNISPSVRMPARPPSASYGSHSMRTAPRNDSNSSGLNVATGLRFVWSRITSSASVFLSRWSARRRIWAYLNRVIISERRLLRRRPVAFFAPRKSSIS
jgi:hypothetical protein